MLAFTIDKDHPLGLRAKVLGLNVGKEKLSEAGGVKNLLDYLDTIYGQDKFVQLYKVYNKFQENKRGKEESVEQCISNFESEVLESEKLGIKYPTVVKAFKLLEGSRVTEIEKKLIVSSVKYENNEAGLYKDMVNSIKKNSGEARALGRTNCEQKVSVEDVEAMAAENAAAFEAAGYRKGGGSRRRSLSDSDAGGLGTNPRGRDGEIMKCFHCKSANHLKPSCEKFKKYKEGLRKSSDSSESNKNTKDGKEVKKETKDNKPKSEKTTLSLFAVKGGNSDSESNFSLALTVEADGEKQTITAKSCVSLFDLSLAPTEGKEQCNLAGGEDPGLAWDSTQTAIQSGRKSLGRQCLVLEEEDSAIVFLSEECRRRGLLDTACTDDVCGKDWMVDYVQGLSAGQRKAVAESPGWRTFKFGGGERLKSLKEVTIPAKFGDQPVLLKVDVVESKIPLLISLGTQKRAGTILDTNTDTAIIAGVKMKLERTRSGHYAINLDGMDADCLVSLTLDEEENWEAALLKLHNQFAHSGRLRKLIETAGRWKPGMEKVLEKIQKEYTATVCRAKCTRPVVAFPRATQFGEILSLDLKIRDKKKDILYLIDCFSRLTLAEMIKDKKAITIAEVVMRRWVGSGYPLPACLHSDNSGEFTGSMMISLAENLNCQVTTSAGRTPYQNGINERGHAVVDRMMEIIIEDNREITEEMALYWACYAKNSLQMHTGFSLFQLVFSANPVIPSNMINSPPALEGKMTSKIFARQLTALHAARQAHTKVEADEKLRKALRHNIRPMGELKVIGDIVFFKRHEDKSWRGPGKVVGIDGKNCLIKQSSLTFSVRQDDAIVVG